MYVHILALKYFSMKLEYVYLTFEILKLSIKEALVKKKNI